MTFWRQTNNVKVIKAAVIPILGCIQKIKVKNLSCLGFRCVSLPDILLMYEYCFYQRPFRGPTAYFKNSHCMKYYEETEKNSILMLGHYRVCIAQKVLLLWLFVSLVVVFLTVMDDLVLPYLILNILHFVKSRNWNLSLILTSCKCLQKTKWNCCVNPSGRNTE